MFIASMVKFTPSPVSGDMYMPLLRSLGKLIADLSYKHLAPPERANIKRALINS
jgi:hypothetical protein